MIFLIAGILVGIAAILFFMAGIIAARETAGMFLLQAIWNPRQLKDMKSIFISCIVICFAIFGVAILLSYISVSMITSYG